MFLDTLNVYCNTEADIQLVRSYTGEEYHLWLERKVRYARKLNEVAKKKHGN